MIKKSVFLSFVVFFSICAVFAASSATDASAALPKLTYEVKLLLDPAKTVNADLTLNAEMNSLFKINKAQKRTVVFVETPDKGFWSKGWINRIREKDGKKNLELTYKMRYSIQDNNISGTVERALKDCPAFSNSKAYEAQIDWGYDKMTLSFSTEKKYSKPKGGLKGMSTAEMVSLITGNMPADEKTAADAALYSATLTATNCVEYVQYTGTFNKTEVDIEVWNPGTEVLVEISFKAKTAESASSLRAELIQMLDRDGLLLHKDSLKTNVILDTLK